MHENEDKNEGLAENDAEVMRMASQSMNSVSPIQEDFALIFALIDPTSPFLIKRCAMPRLSLPRVTMLTSDHPHDPHE